MRFFRKIVPYTSGLYRGLYYVYIRLASKVRLRKKKPGGMNVQIHAAENCNLGCKWCNAFSPLIEDRLADLNALKRDLSRFSELSGGRIGSLAVSGGEPLLNPQLLEIIKHARKCFPGQKLNIITNGIRLIDAGEDFWTTCAECGCTISLTCYPIEIDLKKVRQLALSHNVKLVFQDDTDIRNKTMYFSPLDPSGSQNADESYKLCFMSNTDFVLENGRLYTCPTIAHIEYFNDYFGRNLVVTDRDYIDIYKAENMDAILSFFSKPMPFCSYCNKKGRVPGLGWEVSGKEISEWV